MLVDSGNCPFIEIKQNARNMRKISQQPRNVIDTLFESHYAYCMILPC